MASANDSIIELADHVEYRDPRPFAGIDHPMRKVTRTVAFDGAWTPERAAKVAELFNSMAPDWSKEPVHEDTAAPLLDAIERGSVPTATTWVELGSGTGAAAQVLRGVVDQHVSIDLAIEMLRHAPTWSLRVRADSACLPLTDRSVNVLLLLNMLLFPHEVDRVLADDGVLVWVNALGDQTPIYLSADDVTAALPGEWHGTTARAGTGRWTVLHRM